MMRRLQNQGGFALTELLVVMMISTALLSATLLTFERMVTNENTNDTRNDTAELARNSLEIQTRQARNLAKRVSAATIDTVLPYDLIFQTSDPSRTWIRYCLDTSLGTGNGRLYELVNPTATTVTAAMRGTCAGGSGWTTKRVAATNVVNRIGGASRPVFAYRCVDGSSSCTASTANFDQIVGVNTALYVDTTPAKGPEELKVNTSVFLRNQNQAPKAVIATSLVSANARSMLFNASGSSDYEGRTLQYFWFLNTMPTAVDCHNTTETTSSSGITLWGGNFIGRGIVLQYTWPGTTPASGTNQTVGLVACDPGDRYANPVPTATVKIP
jgi:type II secretory pathway pseudopilin PulG